MAPFDDAPPSIERVLAAEQVTRDETTIEITPADWEPGAAEAGEAGLFVRGVVRSEAGELLLVRNQWGGGWKLPGGTVESAESPDAAVRREVREETGVDCVVERPVRVTRQVFEHAANPERRGTGFLVTFETRATDAEPVVADDPGVDGETIRDVAWFDAVPDECANPGLVGEYLEA
jgi:ADP-ribose pyrophosphatase YjhB (NUDIX family)